MKKLTCAVLISQAFLFQSQLLHADDYSDCKAQCARDYAECLNQPRASEPEEQTASEAACTQKQESCNAECEKNRPVNEDLGPKTVPDRP